jgi:hypothetical protein
MTFHPSLNVSRKDLYREIYDERQDLEMCTLHLAVVLMNADGFELAFLRISKSLGS